MDEIIWVTVVPAQVASDILYPFFLLAGIVFFVMGIVYLRKKLNN